MGVEDCVGIERKYSADEDVDRQRPLRSSRSKSKSMFLLGDAVPRRSACSIRVSFVLVAAAAACCASYTICVEAFCVPYQKKLSSLTISNIDSNQMRLRRTIPWTTTTSNSNLVSASVLFMSDDIDFDIDAEKTSATQTSQPDDSEWKALVAAFNMYKAAYGDLKVPSRFVVPAMPPWPESAWNVKLGQRVASIRSTGKYVQNNEARRKLLEDMGFLWRLRAVSPEKSMEGITFDQIYDALLTYKQEFPTQLGGINVPINFIVPDCDPWPESTRGLPLGKKFPMVRTKNYLKANPGATGKLTSLGFEFDGKVAANDARFNKVFEALKRYKEIYGDLLVPQPFVIPEGSADWPKETWGVRLGARVNAIRSQGTFVNKNPERREMLDDIGFAWSPPLSERGRKPGRRKKEENEALAGLAPPGILTSDVNINNNSYDSVNNNMINNGVNGNEEQNAGDVSSTASNMDSLFGPSFGLSGDPLEMEKTPPTWAFENGGEIGEQARAVEEAKAAASDDEFKAPLTLSETLSAALDRAVECGVIQERAGDKLMRKGKQDKEFPWFNDDFGDDFVFEDAVEALTVYKGIHDDFAVDDEFVVPSVDSDSSEGNEFESDDLDAPDGDSMMLQLEKSIVAGGTDEAAEQWPEHLHGMKLGNIVHRIRDGSLEVKHLPDRKADLDKIDFDWGDPERFLNIPFEKAMCAMYAYYLVRGDMFVYEDFVMPGEDPWPRALAGYEIGKVVREIRELQNFIEAYHRDKLMLLRSIDFVWFPTLAVPIDPNEVDMTPEMLLVSANGHPDYSKMVDIPMGLPDKIIADGPFFETENPKLWWRKWHSWDHVKEYWYNQGRRDNAYVLRGMGYDQLAEEHEAKYGKGMFQQIEELLKEIEEGRKKSKEEYEDMLRQLTFFYDELQGCKDGPPVIRKERIEGVDAAMLTVMKEGDIKLEAADADNVDEEEMEIDGEEYEYVEVEEEEVEEELEEDVDLGVELGL